MKFLVKPIRKIEPSPKSLKSINDRIDFIRCIFGYEVNRFNTLSGTTKGALMNVLKIESPSEPRLTMIKAICAALPVHREWLVFGTGEVFTKSDITPYIQGPENKPRVNSWAVIDPEILKRIIEVRVDKELTQTTFGAKMNVNRSIIASIEGGKVNPSIMFIINFCKVFNVNSNWLLFGIGEKYFQGALVKLIGKPNYQ